MNTENITDITMNFNNPKWILDHITIALQCTSDECIVKRPCDLDGIEQYLILRGEQDGAHYSVKVVPVLLLTPALKKTMHGTGLLKTSVQIHRLPASEKSCQT